MDQATASQRPAPDPDLPLDDDHPVEPGNQEIFDEFGNWEIHQRLWIKAISPLLSLDVPEAHDDPWRRQAVQGVVVAACDRLVRILRSDVHPDMEDPT